MMNMPADHVVHARGPWSTCPGTKSSMPGETGWKVGSARGYDACDGQWDAVIQPGRNKIERFRRPRDLQIRFGELSIPTEPGNIVEPGSQRRLFSRLPPHHRDRDVIVRNHGPDE